MDKAEGRPATASELGYRTTDRVLHIEAAMDYEQGMRCNTCLDNPVVAVLMIGTRRSNYRIRLCRNCGVMLRRRALQTLRWLV